MNILLGRLFSSTREPGHSRFLYLFYLCGLILPSAHCNKRRPRSTNFEWLRGLRIWGALLWQIISINHYEMRQLSGIRISGLMEIWQLLVELYLMEWKWFQQSWFWLTFGGWYESLSRQIIENSFWKISQEQFLLDHLLTKVSLTKRAF